VEPGGGRIGAQDGEDLIGGPKGEGRVRERTLNWRKVRGQWRDESPKQRRVNTMRGKGGDGKFGDGARGPGGFSIFLRSPERLFSLRFLMT